MALADVVDPDNAPYASQVEDDRKHGRISYQQYVQRIKTALPDPAFSGPMSGEQQIRDDAAHGRISYQQELAALRTPGTYTGPPTAATPAAQAPAPQPAPAVQPGAAAPVQGVAYKSGESAPGGPPATSLYSLSPQEAMRIGAWAPGGGQAAHWSPTTRSATFEGRAPSNDYEQAVANKLEADTGATLAQNQYDTALGGAQSEAARRMAVIDEMQARDQAQRAQMTQQRLAVDRDHIQNLMQQAAKPQQSASEEYWGSKSTFGKVMTGLSMALRGFVFSGYGRGGDPMEWLNQQIGQVVQDQQNRAARNREAVGNSRDLYSMNREALGDDERAKLATEMALRTQVGAQLDRRIAEAVADPAAQLRGAQLKKAIADQNEATLEQYWDKTADKHTSTEGATFRPATTGGRDPLEVLRRGAEAKKLGVEVANETDATKAQLEEQKARADIAKTAAETGKTVAEVNAIPKPGTGIGSEPIPSTAYDLTRWFQDTDAHAKTIAQDAYNARLSIDLTKLGMSPRIAKDTIDKLSIHQGDTPKTIMEKQRQRAQLLGAPSAASIPGVTLGTLPEGGQ